MKQPLNLVADTIRHARARVFVEKSKEAVRAAMSRREMDSACSLLKAALEYQESMK